MAPVTAYSLLGVAQFAVAVNVVTSKDALVHFPTYAFCGLRFFVSAFLLGCFFFASRTPLKDPRHPNGSLDRSDYGKLIGQALTGGFLFNVVFYFGLDHTTATSAGIIASTLPIFMALLALFLLREHISGPKWAAIAMSVLGIAVLASDNTAASGATGSWIGDALILFAMLPEAAYSIIARTLSGKVTPLGAAFVANALTALLLIPFMLPSLQQAWLAIDTKIMIQIVAAGLTSFVFFWAWGSALQTVPTSTAALFGGVMPVATAILAIVFLGEKLLLTNLLGMSLVLIAIFLGRDRPRQRLR